ncbi:MAG: thioredoxin [Deltaproteobacteria bacterium CG11_big_fil_rev_8_21_14_0_20_49_13]|nr:MAG: thioredoxin [Deltaproteobacteria bacterium CG11_big_fil_rev_8_21_14_0_20_49_13]
MKLKLTLLFVLLAVILGKFTYDQIVPPFKKGDAAPEFSLSDLDGKTVRFSDFSGGPLLVHFWATWCNQCVEELPSLSKFSEKFPDAKVVAISEDEAGSDAVLKFFGNIKPSFLVLLDPEGHVADKYKSYKVPETYLIDKDGKILHHFIGAVSWTNPKVASFIRGSIADSAAFE